jgi:hypothetical protein
MQATPKHKTFQYGVENSSVVTCRKVNKGFSLVLDEYVVAKLEVVGDPGESMAPSEDDS